MSGTTSSDVLGLVAAVLTLAATFFLDFRKSGLVVSVDLGLEFLGPVFIFVAVTLGCDGDSVIGRGGNRNCGWSASGGS